MKINKSIVRINMSYIREDESYLVFDQYVMYTPSKVVDGVITDPVNVSSVCQVLKLNKTNILLNLN